MTISFVAADAANATSITMPAHQKWDMLVMFVGRNASTTSPTVPSGWSVVGWAVGASNGIWLAVRIAESASEVSGTWTNADHIAVGVYRSDTSLLSVNNGVPIQGTAGSGGAINHPALLVVSPVTNKWLLAGYIHRSIDTDIQVGPTGLTTNRANTIGGAAGEMGFRDSNGNFTSWSLTSYTLTAGTSSGYHTQMAELSESPILLSSLGGGGGAPSFGPLSMSGPSFRGLS
jgi:hypothetical protein